MRIISGKYRGRNLISPQTTSIRPTGDRVRESLFSMLTSRYCDFGNSPRVLDLFAGTGALGLEAISRGAQFCLFVENSTAGHILIQKNIDALELKHQTKIMRMDATRLKSNDNIKPFDLIFADPPLWQGAGRNCNFAPSKFWLVK